MKTVLKSGDLVDLAGILVENGYEESNLIINIEVPDSETLNRISDELFYQTHGSESGMTPPTITDHIDVNVGKVRYKYIIKERSLE